MAHLHPLLIRSPWNIFSSVQIKDDKRYLALAFTDLFQPSIICGWGVLTKKLYFWFDVPKERMVTLRAGPSCEGPSNMVKKPNICCFVGKLVLSWVMRVGGVAKKWWMMTRGGHNQSLTRVSISRRNDSYFSLSSWRIVFSFLFLSSIFKILRQKSSF